jgi:hypothetical protein
MAAADDKQVELEVSRGNASFRAAGPFKLVMEAWEKFENDTATTTSKGGGGTEVKRRQGDSPSPSNLKKDPLSKVIARDEIKGNAEIVTAIIAWAKDRDDKNSLTKADIETYWKDKTNEKVPKNLSRDIAAAVKKGYLDGSEGNYRVLGYGRRELGLS